MRRGLETGKTMEDGCLCGGGQEGGTDKGSKAAEKDTRKELLCKQSVAERPCVLNTPLLQCYLNPPLPDENRKTKW